MGKRIQKATLGAWSRFRQIDRQAARTAAEFTKAFPQERQFLNSMPDYSAVNAQADSGARTAGY